MDDPYRELANAIVIRAAKDYRRALRQLRRNPDYERAFLQKAEVEQFFRSKWFCYLTTVNPDYLISKITGANS